MRFFRVTLALALAVALEGCGYIHFGRLPQGATVAGDAGMGDAYSSLLTEHKILKQELALARKEGDALRSAMDRGPGAAISPELLAQLNQTSRELAALRASYAKLQGDRASPAGPSDAGSAARLSELEEKLATSLRSYTQLQEENARLRTDIDRTHAENSTLSSQLKIAVSQNEAAQSTLAQLNTELLAQKEARARAEQTAAAARVQLGAVIARRDRLEPARDAAASPGSSDLAGTNSLALAKAPPADSSATAELRTNAERLRQAAGPAGADSAGANPVAAVRTHTVQQGDTLEKIAQKYYADPKRWVKIYTANNDLLRNGQVLKPGMELEIPQD